MRYNTQFRDNNFLTPTIYTQEMSEYAEQVKYEDLPPEVVERAKMILLHTVGAALAAKNSPVTEKVCKMSLEANNGEGGPVTVWGLGKKMSAVNAAMVMGTMADVLDWEDCSWTGHPAASVVPCAWTAAVERHKSGKDLITAIVVAYELYQRIAMAVQPSSEQWKSRGWGLMNWQIFAATIPVCKAYGLDARKINQAIGMACENSTLPTAYHAATMSDFRSYEYGFRARDGFLITKSVEKGINNNLDGLDVPRCYTGTLCGDGGSHSSVGEKIEKTTNDADMTWLTRDLGKQYLIMETLLKAWPADMWSQGAVELVCKMAREDGFGPDDIAGITVDPATENRMWAPDEGFISTVQAQFSLPYSIAAALYAPIPGANWYSAEMLNDPKILALAKRVKAGPSAEDSISAEFDLFRSGNYPTKKICITLKNGKKYEGATDCPVGHPKNMLDRTEWIRRFCTQAAGTFPAEHLEEIAQALCSIENVGDVADLDGLLG